ncbi:MAG: hypothetical protein HXY25_08565 [Alphaproteobacteria bacterium]|nr:hypothetical protein [Alphaproteobacteria bacterium]
MPKRLLPRLAVLAALALAILLVPVPRPAQVMAGSGGGESASKGGHGEERSAKGGHGEEEAASGGLFNAPREVDIPTMVAPVVGEGGAILAYAYLTLQVEVQGVDVWAVREKIPFLQDAFLREIFARSIARGEGPVAVDEAALAARLKAQASAVIDKGTVTRIIIKKMDIGPA